MKTSPLLLTAALLGTLFLAPASAAPRGKMDKPDFTKGDAIPEGATHDWTLGATGTRGWMFSDRLTTIDARQIRITKVEKGSPADGLLHVGDVILGVDGKPFSYNARTEIGKALTTAESDQGGGKLPLLRWRDGTTEKVTLQLPVLGTYSPTAPYDCPKSKRILEQGCAALAKRVAAPDYRQNPTTRSLNTLALLASGNPDYLPLVRKEAEWAAGFSADSMATWWYGYVITFLAEYTMATGDDSFLPGLRRLALEAAEGQSIVGSWGHKFAGPDGRLLGYGMMNAPGVPLTTGLVLARAAGVEDPKVDLAIERSAKLLRFYIGKGAIPYGDHAPWMQTHEDNGKCGMAAVLFNLLGEEEGAAFFSWMSVASHGNERDGGHTGNFWNITWAMPGVAQAGPHATGAWMNEFGAWYYDLARRWDGNFIHQGPPSMTPDKTRNWDATGAYLLAYAMPLKKICLTGRKPGVAPQLDATAAQSLILDGRGWNNKDRNSFYDALTDEELHERLGSWSPIVRGRSASALSRRKSESLPVLLKMLESPRLEDRYGACEALKTLRGAAAPAVPALRKTLEADDLWLRIEAAEALAATGEAGQDALPQLLRMITKGPSKEDPRAMEQRYLCFTVFGGMLKKSIEGVDRDLLRAAVGAGLQNQDGRSRGTIGGIYDMLTYEEIKPLLPAVYEATKNPSPSGIMFASGIRVNGLNILAKHRIKEGLPLCVEVMEIQKWGKAGRIPKCLDAIETYGPAAKAILPQLKELEKEFASHREAKKLLPFAERLNRIIRQLENTAEAADLRNLPS